MSVTEFFAMNGYGFYIWSSFGMAAILLMIELFSLQIDRSKAIRNIRKTAQLRRNQDETKN